jgi:hypothetical protein
MATNRGLQQDQQQRGQGGVTLRINLTRILRTIGAGPVNGTVFLEHSYILPILFLMKLFYP